MNLLEITSYTWIVTFVGWGIVFFALIVLVLLFMLIPQLFKINFKDLFSNKKGSKISEVTKTTDGITGTEIAAISMALAMYYNELHEDESNIITIKQIQKRYSPWNSKLFGMNNVIFMNNPRKR